MEKLTLEESEQLAQHIEFVKLYLHLINREVLEKAFQEITNAASRYDATAVLNPNWNGEKAPLLWEQSRSLGHLKALIESLKKCDELKTLVKREDEGKDKLRRLFDL